MEARSHPSRGHGLTLRTPRAVLRRLSDDRLLAIARAGDEEAFAAIYDRHAPALLSFASRLLGSSEDAEDVVQHTMLMAHRELSGNGPELRLKPWLFTVTRNRALSLLRSRRDEPSPDLDPPAPVGLPEQVQGRADLAELLADLDRLPEFQRSALLLAELGGFSQSEIGSVLDRRPEQVKALVFQARSGLISRREARETPCEEIRMQLATLSGSALRRRQIRDHIAGCKGCERFAADVRNQRRALALALPVLPSAGLREAVLGSLGIGGGGLAGGVAAGGAGAGALAGSITVGKTAAVLACAVLGAGAAVELATRETPSARPSPADQDSRSPGRSIARPLEPAVEAVPTTGAARAERDRDPVATFLQERDHQREQNRERRAENRAAERAVAADNSGAGGNGPAAPAVASPSPPAPPSTGAGRSGFSASRTGEPPGRTGKQTSPGHGKSTAPGASTGNAGVKRTGNGGGASSDAARSSHGDRAVEKGSRPASTGGANANAGGGSSNVGGPKPGRGADGGGKPDKP